MALLPTNKSRPNLPYVPEQSLPNSNRYQALGNFPPKAEQIDADLNAAFDGLNDLAEAINDTAAGTFPGSNDITNANKIPTTDGQGNLSWTKVNSFNMAEGAVQSKQLQAQSVTSDKIQIGAVGDAQIGLMSVKNQHIALGTILGENIANSTIPLNKLTLASESCIMGAGTNSPYYGVKINPWEVVTITSEGGGPVSQPLSTIWNYDPHLFDGRKMQDQSIDNSKMALKTMTRDQIADLTITGDQMAPSTITPDKITFKSLADDQLTDGGLTGRVFADNSIPISKVMNPQYIAPFAMATCSLGGLVLSQNISSFNISGSFYNLQFLTPARSANYVVQLTSAVSANNNGPLCINVVQTSQTGITVEVQNPFGSAVVDRVFYLVIYDF